MDVILDTNIYRQDFALSSGRFEVLVDYVGKSDTRIILPGLVRDEIMGLLRRELADRLGRIEGAQRDIRALAPHLGPMDKAIIGDLEEVAHGYIEYLRNRLSISQQQVVELKNEYLGDVVARAIERRRPCSDKGEEIRDALLWLTVLDVAAASESKTVAFVSQNTRQFCGEADALHRSLAEESAARGLTVHFYPHLDAFAKEHAARLAFATPAWLQAAIPDDEVFDRAYDGVAELAREEARHHMGSDWVMLDDWELEAGGVSDPEYSLHQQVGGTYRLLATYHGWADFRFSITKRALGAYSGVYSGHLPVHVDLRVFVFALVRDGRVESWDVDEVAAL